MNHLRDLSNEKVCKSSKGEMQYIYGFGAGFSSNRSTKFDAGLLVKCRGIYALELILGSLFRVQSLLVPLVYSSLHF